MFAVLSPEASWDEIFALAEIIDGRTPEQEGYCRLSCMVAPTYSNTVIECTKDSEFVLPSGELLGVFT